jgi:hypothetical protein
MMSDESKTELCICDKPNCRRTSNKQSYWVTLYMNYLLHPSDIQGVSKRALQP